MEANEELMALSAVYGDMVTVLGSNSCRIVLSRVAVEVVWCVDALPHVTVSEAALAHHAEEVLRGAVVGDAIVFELVERVREAENALAAAEEQATASAAVAETPKKSEAKKPKPHDKRTGQKPAGDRKSKSGGAGGGSSGGGGGGGGGGKANAHHKQSTKPQKEKAAAPVVVMNNILAPDQENRLAVLLKLDESDNVPPPGFGSIVSGSSDQRTKTRLAKCYAKLEAAGLDHDTIVQGMSALVGGSYDAIVDWLLLHVPREKLPTTLGGDVSGGGADKSADEGGDGKKKVELTKKRDELREYEFGNWTGKFPKSLMHEWAQRKSFSKPAYNRARHKGAGLRYKVSMTVEGNKLSDYKKGAVVEFECPEACKDEVQGQNLAATYALFCLNKNLSLHTLLPPSYRAAWERWLSQEKAVKVESQQSKEKPKKEFLEQLFEKISNTRSSLGHVQASFAMPLAAASGGNNNNKAAPAADNASFARGGGGGDNGKAVRQASAVLKTWFENRTKEPRYEKMLRGRSTLPITQFRDSILRQVRQNQVTCVSGATGCGKSTQFPQFLLEHALCSDAASETHIVCTQPRRISAQSIAERVAEEMADELGGLVGYKVRLDSKVSRRTQLMYCTTGVLLRRLQSDPLLSGTSHLVIDEVHERSLETDFLLVILLDVLQKRRDLKLVLMSATADVELFSRYFGGANIVDVPGRTFSCESFYVEDLVKMTGYRIEEGSEYAVEDTYQVREIDLEVTGKLGEKGLERVEYETHNVRSAVAPYLDEKVYDLGVRRTVDTMDHFCINQELIEEILLILERSEPFASKDGAVLLFLPSLAEIASLLSRLEDHPILGDDRRFILVPLHGVLASKDQRKAFDVAPKGMRKIVLATNIAETGVTIPDVVFVIDCGFENSMRYDPGSRISGLKTVRISRASSKQRAGRAGRVQPGFAFKLYTRNCFEVEMEEQSRPEILRQPLETLCLQILDMGWRPDEFLARALSPPSKQSVDASMAILKEVGALDGQVLSPLGRLLAQLPLEPFVGKMIVYAAVLRCLSPVSIMAAATMCQSPFHRPPGREAQADKAKREFAVKGSDHFALYKMYKAWVSSRRWEWCRQHFVDNQRMETIHKSAQDLESTVKTLFGKTGINFDANSNCAGIIQVALAAGMFPRVAQIGADGIIRYGAKAKKVAIHPSSCNSRANTPQHLLYQAVFKSAQGKVYLKETTAVGGIPLLLFSSSCVLNAESNTVQLDNGIVVKASARSAAIVRKFAQHFNKLFETPDASIFQSPILKEFEEILKERKPQH